MSKIDQIIQGMQSATKPSCYWANPDVGFPELEASKRIIQRNNQSVWDHTMSVIDAITIKNPITLLSGLFHDLGKGCVSPMNDPSLPRFPGHVHESANIAEDVLTKWQAPPYMIDRVLRIVSMHMYDISNAAREKTIRKFVADVGLDNVDNWFVIRIADSSSYAAQQQYRSRFIEPFKTAVMSYLGQRPIADRPEFDREETENRIQIEGGDAS